MIPGEHGRKRRTIVLLHDFDEYGERGKDCVLELRDMGCMLKTKIGV
jgi:hypothetical protein